MKTELYEVWFSSGHGIHLGPRFRFIEDAVRYVYNHLQEASFAIRNPAGEWELVKRRHAPVRTAHR